MKQRIYLRVARKNNPYRGQRYKVAVSEEHDPRPLEQGPFALPTASFALEIEIPDSAFSPPQPVALVHIEEASLLPVAELRLIPAESA